MKQYSNIPIILTGPSGAGKTELTNYITKRYDTFKEAIGYTTREKRIDDDGKIISISREQFTKLILNDELIEYGIYNENFYGIPKSEFEKLEQYNLIFNVGYSSAKIIKKMHKEALMIYLLPPNKEELLRRLENRDKEHKRYMLGMEETKNNSHMYEYLLISKTNDLEAICNDFMQIVNKNKIQIQDRLKMKENRDFIDDFYR